MNDDSDVNFWFNINASIKEQKRQRAVKRKKARETSGIACVKLTFSQPKRLITTMKSLNSSFFGTFRALPNCPTESHPELEPPTNRASDKSGKNQADSGEKMKKFGHFGPPARLVPDSSPTFTFWSGSVEIRTWIYNFGLGPSTKFSTIETSSVHCVFKAVQPVCLDWSGPNFDRIKGS